MEATEWPVVLCFLALRIRFAFLYVLSLKSSERFLSPPFIRPAKTAAACSLTSTWQSASSFSTVVQICRFSSHERIKVCLYINVRRYVSVADLVRQFESSADFNMTATTF
uniref:Uncharacterized protein n=1 Tax=Opuntia streptacantha TaxID=393608 RepID=A0A7C9EW93_OPUST